MGLHSSRKPRDFRKCRFLQEAVALVLNNDVETAIVSVHEDGFTPDNPRFEAEIDWGYSNMTLSFSSDIEIKAKELPDITKLTRSDAIQMLTDHMPPEEKRMLQALKTYSSSVL